VLASKADLARIGRYIVARTSLSLAITRCSMPCCPSVLTLISRASGQDDLPAV